MKDAWERATQVATIATPLVVSLIGCWIAWSVAERGAEAETVQTALAILQKPPDTSDRSKMALREWSIAVVDEYSGIRLTPDARGALMSNQLPIYRYADELPDLSQEDVDRILADLLETAWDIREKHKLEDMKPAQP